MSSPDRISLGKPTDEHHAGVQRKPVTPVEVSPQPTGNVRVPSRGDVTLSFEGEWNPATLETSMASAGMTLSRSNEAMSRWTKVPDKSQAYPLLADALVNKEAGVVRLRGFVLDDDGKTRLTIDGDDGVPHHAKAGALADFEAICDTLRQELDKKDEKDEELARAVPQGQPATSAWQAQAPPPQTYFPSQQTYQVQWQQHPVPGQPMMRQGLPYGMPSGAPVPQQTQEGYYGYSQQPPQVPPAQPVGRQMPQEQRQQFGYGSPETEPQQGQPSVAPGWAIQSVPNNCWGYIAISCIELILLVAESIYINYVVSLFPILFLSWPAIPAIVFSVSYKKAFQSGNAQMAMIKMRWARGWIIGAAIWCLVRVIFKLTMCSWLY